MKIIVSSGSLMRDQSTVVEGKSYSYLDVEFIAEKFNVPFHLVFRVPKNMYDFTNSNFGDDTMDAVIRHIVKRLTIDSEIIDIVDDIDAAAGDDEYQRASFNTIIDKLKTMFEL